MKRAKITKRPYTYKDKTEDRWVVHWTDLKGTRREYWKCQNKRHAEAYATKIDRELQDNIHTADRGTISFQQAAEAYLKWIDQRHESRNRDIAGSTRQKYHRCVRVHLIPHFGRLRLNQIKTVEVQRFIDEKAQKYSRNFVEDILLALKEILNFAVNNNDEWLARNPLKDKPVKVPGKNKRRSDVPDYAEVRQLFAFLFGAKQHQFKRFSWTNYRVMVCLAAFGGLRAGECAGLKWEHIDWVNNDILVQASRSKFDGDKGPKSEAGNRPVPINPILRRVLEEHHAYWRHVSEGHVLRNREGGPWSTDGIQFGFVRIMHLAGLTRPGGVNGWLTLFSFHALRHFAVSVWLHHGMRIQDVQRHIGHSSIQVTMDTYAHMLKGDNHSREAISKTIAMFPDMPTSLPKVRTIDEMPLVPAMIEGTPLPAKPAFHAIEARTVSAEELMTVGDMIVGANGEIMKLQAPSKGPAWMPEMLKLLRGGWQLTDACEAIGIHRTSVLAAFKRYGLPNPRDIAQAVRYTRFAAFADAGYGDKEIAEKCGCDVVTVWGWRALRDGRGERIPFNPLKCNVKTGGSVKLKTGKLRGKQLNLL